MARRPIDGSAVDGTSNPTTAPTSSIAHNPRNPRDSYDDIGELAKSIKVAGIMSPLGVVRYETFLIAFPEHEREIGTCDWVVLNGNRRLAAASLLDISEVPVTVVDRLGREEMFDEGVLIDNIHNEKLPALREAAALQMLVDRHGSGAAVAERLGKTPAYVSQRLGLLRLTEDLQQEFRKGALSFDDARKLSSFPAEQQAGQWERLKSLVESEGDTEAGREAWAEENRAAKSDDAPAMGRPKSQAGRPRVKSVKIGAPDKMAAQLRERLTPEDLSTLVKLLLDEQ